MKHIYIILLSLLLPLGLSAQRFTWTKGGGSPSGDGGQRILVDPWKNVYVAGVYYDDCTLFGQSISKHGKSANNDIFFAKFDSSGNLIWLNTIGSAEHEFLKAAAMDSRGNLYLGGGFTGYCNFGNSMVMPAGKGLGGQDIFVAKYDTGGNEQWVFHGGDINNDFATCISIDKQDRIYVSGCYDGTVTLDTVTLKKFGGIDIFYACLDTLGTMRWVREFGSADGDNAAYILPDEKGGLYFAGSTQRQLTFGSNTVGTKATNLKSTCFIGTMDTAGYVRGARRFFSAQPLQMHFRAPNALYATGYYTDTASYQGVKIKGTNLEIFAMKMDSSMDLQWLKGFGTTGYDVAVGTVLDEDENLYFSGYFGGKISFGSKTYTANGTTDGYIASLDSAGAARWFLPVGNTGTENITCLGLDGENHLYASGSYTNTVVFGNTKMKSNGTNDVFFSQLNICTPPTVSLMLPGKATLCPGDTSLLQATAGLRYYGWYRNGSLLPDSTSSLRPTLTGSYSVLAGTRTCATEAGPISLRFKNWPIAPTISGASSGFCKGDSLQLSHSGSSGPSYTWFRDTMAVSVSNNLWASQGGTYTVSASDSGCASRSLPFTVSAWPQPAKPLISRSKDTLFSSLADHYQWYRDTTALSDTGMAFRPTALGCYKVKVSNAYGCTNMSDTACVSVLTGVANAEEPSFGSWRILPSPAHDYFRVEGLGRGLHLYRLLSLQGQKLQSGSLQEREAISLSGLPAGAYLMEIAGERKLLLLQH